MNFIDYSTDREDKVHFSQEYHKKLAEIIIGKLRNIDLLDE